MIKNRTISRADAAPAKPTVFGAALFATIITLPIGVVLMIIDLTLI